MLAARALGIGSCITTIHRYRDGQLKALLGIPPEVETAAVVPLGYPLGKFGRPPRPAHGGGGVRRSLRAPMSEMGGANRRSS